MATATAVEMETLQFDGEIETFEGKKISPALKFSGPYEAYRSYDDVPAKEKLDEKDCLKIVNDSLKSTARAKRMAEVLKENGYVKTDLNTPEGTRLTMIKSLLKNKPHLTPEQAAETIDGMLGAVG